MMFGFLVQIFYNERYRWSAKDELPRGHIDFPTVAMHEVGHGLSLDQFGTIGVKDGYLFVKPRGVMNAIYSGKTELTGRDQAAFCASWASLPKN